MYTIQNIFPSEQHVCNDKFIVQRFHILPIQKTIPTPTTHVVWSNMWSSQPARNYNNQTRNLTIRYATFLDRVASSHGYTLILELTKVCLCYRHCEMLGVTTETVGRQCFVCKANKLRCIRLVRGRSCKHCYLD